MKINSDYFNIFKEPALFVMLIIRNALKRKRGAKSNTILIVNVCLIGDFAASAPALSAYIGSHLGATIDLLVSPPLQSLAERMTGVRKVYTASSVFARELEQSRSAAQKFDSYEKILALRISHDAYRVLDTVTTGELQTGFAYFIAYGVHLMWNLIIGKTPRSWREVNFDMVGAASREVSFEEIFSIPAGDSARIHALSELCFEQKKIIIHTGGSWLMNTWGTDKWIELIKKLQKLGDFRFIFVGAKKDERDYRYISARLPFPTYSLIDRIDILDLVLVLHASDYFIGVDSGPRNLAHLAGLPSVTLLGPAPHMFTPPNSNGIVIDRSGGRGLYQRFFRQKNGFIDLITPSDVCAAFSELLSTPRSPND